MSVPPSTRVMIGLLAGAAILASACPGRQDGDVCEARRVRAAADLEAGRDFQFVCAEERDAGGLCEEACGVPGNCGNELGVGQFCTRGGGECSGNGFETGAFLCILDTEPDEFPTCIRPCQYDDECGTAAFCAGQGGLRGCLPRVCAPENPGNPRPGPDAGSDTDPDAGSDAPAAGGDDPDGGP